MRTPARVVAACAAVIGCATLAPTFLVQPALLRLSALRGGQAETAEAGTLINGAAGVGVASAAVVMAAGMAAIAAMRRPIAPSVRKVTRHFFQGNATGGGATKQFDPTTQLGVQAPARYWDPLGLSIGTDEATFKRRRAVEIKHGRICMLACIGYIVPEYFRWPGYLSPSEGLKFSDVPNGLAALSKVPFLGWVQIVIYIGMCEASGLGRGRGAPIGFMKDASMAGEPGNYGLGFLGAGLFGPVKDKEIRDRKLNAEIANGRLAMIAIMSMLFQNGVTGTTGPEMWGGLIFELPGLKILLPSLGLFALAGESFRRGPDPAFQKEVDRPDVYKYRGRV